MMNNFGGAPVNEGDEIDVKIEAIGDKGDGIAKKDGFVLVIPGTKLNETVRVRITKVLKKVGFAQVVEGASPEVSEEPKDDSASISDDDINQAASEETKVSEEPQEDSEDF